MASRLQSGGSSSAVQRAAGNAASGGGVPYTVLSSVAVRSEAATTSAKVDTLAAGVEILVLEKRVLQDGTVRLRFSGGWISEKLKKTHKVLAAPTDSISSEAKPPSAGCADASSARQAIAAENAKMREELAQVEAEIAQTDSMIDKARAARKSPALSRLRPTDKQEHAHLRLNSAPGRVAKRPPVPNQRAVRPRSSPVSSQARTAYKALAVGVIRRGPELTSAKVATLEVGQAVEALEKRTLKDGTVRLRLKAGWVSKVAKSGKPLLEHVTARSVAVASVAAAMIADNKVTEAAARKQLADATVAAAAPTATETVESLAARIESMAAQLDAISHSVVQMEARIAKVERTQEEMRWG